MKEYIIEPVVSWRPSNNRYKIDITFSAEEICRNNRPNVDLLTFCYMNKLLARYEKDGKIIERCIINSIKLIECNDLQKNEMAKKAIKFLEFLINKKIFIENTDQEIEEENNSKECYTQPPEQLEKDECEKESSSKECYTQPPEQLEEDECEEESIPFDCYTQNPELWKENEEGKDRLFKLNMIVIEMKELRHQIDFIYDYELPESYENIQKLGDVVFFMDYAIENLESAQDELWNVYYGEASIDY